MPGAVQGSGCISELNKACLQALGDYRMLSPNEEYGSLGPLTDPASNPLGAQANPFPSQDSGVASDSEARG